MRVSDEQLALPLRLPGCRRRLPGGLHVCRGVASFAGAVLLAGVSVSLLPYRTTVASVPVEVSASVTPSHKGLTLDSSVGSLQFREVTALPLGLHARPRVDLDGVRAASEDGAAFSARARADVRARLPGLLAHLVVVAGAGLLLGALCGAVLAEGAVSLLTGQSIPAPLARGARLRRALQRVAGVSALLGVGTVVAGVGTYRPDWSSSYAITGLLADVAATPAQLATLDARDASAAAKLRAVLRLQDALTAPASSSATPAAAFRVLLVSDVHRRGVYPYLQQYVDANDVRLIVNTGDETLVGNPVELTPDYLASIAAVTRRAPMLWVKGNHDSAVVARVMDAVPGVTVLDGQVVTAYGLQVYGTSDPRTYGGSGDLGSDDPDTVTRVETEGARRALGGLDPRARLDLLLAHEPVEADVLSATLGASVRAQASGHLHRQNAESDLQARGRSRIRLVEGSTGLGGLLADAGDRMQFSIMSVAADCQFTRLVRFKLSDPALPAQDQAVGFGTSSSFVVHYFSPQPLSPGRTCSVERGVSGPVRPDAPGLLRVRDEGTSSPAPLSSPTQVSVEDEAPDRGVGAPARATATATTAVRHRR